MTPIASPANSSATATEVQAPLDEAVEPDDAVPGPGTAAPVVRRGGRGRRLVLVAVAVLLVLGGSVGALFALGLVPGTEPAASGAAATPAPSGFSSATPTIAVTSTPTATPTPAAFTRVEAEQFYLANCALCHGARQQGVVGGPLRPDRLQQEDDVYVDAILKGIPGSAMPPWESLLTEQEAASLVSYLQQLPPDPAAEVVPTIGGSVTVVGTGDCLRIRAVATVSSPRIGCLDDGTRATVVDGPREADGYTWWRLDGQGWSAGAFLATDAVAEVVHAIERRDMQALENSYIQNRAACGEGAIPIACFGATAGTEVDYFLGPGGGCHFGHYETPRSPVDAFLQALPDVPLEIVVDVRSAAGQVDEADLIYRRLGVAGDRGHISTVQVLSGGLIRYMTLGGC